MKNGPRSSATSAWNNRHCQDIFVSIDNLARATLKNKVGKWLLWFQNSKRTMHVTIHSWNFKHLPKVDVTHSKSLTWTLKQYGTQAISSHFKMIKKKVDYCEAPLKNTVASPLLPNMMKCKCQTRLPIKINTQKWRQNACRNCLQTLEYWQHRAVKSRLRG